MFASKCLMPVVWAVLASFLFSPALAARRAPVASPQRPASVEVSPNGVLWRLAGDFAGGALIVRGPAGWTARRDFRSGASPWLGLESLGPDPVEGRYLWEIRLTPAISPELGEALREAAEGDQPERTGELNRAYGISHRHLVQTGRFHYRAGRFEADGDDMETEGAAGDLAVARPDRGQPKAGYDVSGSWTITDDVGVGTDLPNHRLDIVDAGPTIQMEDSSDGSSWFVNGDMAGFDIRRGGNMPSDIVFSLDPASPKPSLVVDSMGDWGNGTSLPSAPLHVYRSDGTARVLVDDNAPTVARRTLFQLENNGGISFRFLNKSTGANWFFTQDGADNFAVSLSGTGGPELVVNKDGRVQMGPGAATVFNLAPGGNLTIGGVLTELSDRDAKENFQPVDVGQILEKVVSLPLSVWNLKTDSAGARHLGPTAQDFRATFGLGSDARHIAEVDRSGVALAAIQGLNQQLRRREAELAALRAQVQSQAARIEALTAGLESLKKSSSER